MSYSGGVFSINTTGQPVVSGTTISASVFNALTSDLATGLSTCMLKDGTQTATAGIGFYAGTVSLPGIYFGTDTATGLYRIGLNNTGYSINGTKLLDLSSALFAVTGAATVSTTLTVGTTLTVTGLTSGRVPYATTAGLITDSANLTFNGTTLTANTIGAFTLGGTVSGGGNQINNVIIGTSNPLAGSFTTLAASTLEVTDNGSQGIRVGASTGTGQIWIGGTAPSANGSGVLRFVNSNSATNWLLASNLNVSGAFEITPSTAGGGTTFTTPEFVLKSTAGGSRLPNGIRIGEDSSNNLLDDASNGAGTATLYIGNASINVTSDEHVKIKVREWDGDASAILRALPVKAWDGYTSNAPMSGYDGIYVGFTAQDMHKVAPWSVNTQGDTGLPWQARYEFLNGIIVKGWQELAKRVDELEKR